MLERIANGRTDLVVEYLAEGQSASAIDANGISLLEWCAYYGDVTAIKLLLAEGTSLASLGDNFDLDGACFHGHPRLCQFLIERGANVNHALPETGETPLHAALCKTSRPAFNRVVRILLTHGANPNSVTKKAAETGAFMRDCRTRGETPLHRAAAFGDEEVIEMLIEAGAALNAKDMNGDSPLTWASWYLRPVSVLRKLCYGDFRIHPDYRGMEANVLGKPDL